MTRGSIFEPAQAKLSAVLTQLNMSMLKGWKVSTKSTVRRGDSRVNIRTGAAKLSAMLTQLNMSMLKGWKVSTKSTVRRG
jgi:hypothetical protein